jgi:thiol-disulfide isomerase/thioredoxin
MKKLLYLSACFFISLSGFSQINSTTGATPAYISNPVIPAFTVYKAPDSTSFTKENLHKRKPTLLMIFSPDCGHCQHETTVLIENLNHFKNTEILMFTWLPYSDMMSFYKNYKIADHPQITMAWDSKDFFLPYYHVQSYPTLVAYNKYGKFVKAFSGDIKMEEVWKALGNK